MNRFAISLCALLSLAPLSARAADTIDKISRADMMSLLKDLGMTDIKDDTTDEQWPSIQFATPGGYVEVVSFFDCQTGVTGPARTCDELLFQTNWNNTKNLDAAALNPYNVQKVFGRAGVSADGKNVSIDWGMDLDGGVTRENLMRNINYYQRTVSDFSTMVKPN